MKARIIGTPCEVEVVPYFPEGMFAGFTDVSGKLQPGMVVYKSSDLEFLETPPKLKREVDWDSFRREAARDILCSIISDKWATKSTVERAVKLADKLVNELKDKVCSTI